MSDCLFCRIIKGDIPCETVYENERVLAFRDINPQTASHVLLLPKQHLDSLNDLQQAEDSLLAALLHAASAVAEKEGIAQSGYRLVSNCGPDARQSVQHLHFHILGGSQLSDRMV